MFLYYALLIGALLETTMTGIIAAHLFFGPAGGRLPVRSLWLFRATQLGEAAFSIFVLLSASPRWPPYYLFFINAAIWLRFMTQVSVYDFHRTAKLWEKRDDYQSDSRGL